MNLRTVTLRTVGTVAILAAVHRAITGMVGVRGVLPERRTGGFTTGERSVDSEIRFYAVWYGLVGVAMHKAARDPIFDRSFRQMLSASWAIGAFARLLSVRAVGRPDPLLLALGGAEIAVAALLATTKSGD